MQISKETAREWLLIHEDATTCYLCLYTGTEEEKDAAALLDLEEWLTEGQLRLMKNLAKFTDTAQDVEVIFTYFDLAGVSGRPVHAFCRKYCPEAFALWEAEASA